MAGETYNVILDSEIDPESPVTESLMHRLRDNPIAMIQGASGAPRATSKIITPGGSDKDGILNDAVGALTLPGFFDWTNIELAADRAIPWISKFRVNGNVEIATGKTLRCVRPNAISADEAEIIALYNAIAGANSAAGASDTGGAGGCVAAGGRSRTTLGSSGSAGGARGVSPNAFSNSYSSFILRRVLLGGSGGLVAGSVPGGGGGGHLCMLVNGDMELTGATIDCSGANGTGGASEAGGGGGGGCLIIICNGNIHDGTFLAMGGNGANSGSQCGGGGGGGLIILVAASFTGFQAKTVTGGTISGGSGPAAAGTNGLAMANLTLTEEIINSIMLGAAA